MIKIFEILLFKVPGLLLFAGGWFVAMKLKNIKRVNSTWWWDLDRREFEILGVFLMSIGLVLFICRF